MDREAVTNLDLELQLLDPMTKQIQLTLGPGQYVVGPERSVQITVDGSKIVVATAINKGPTVQKGTPGKEVELYHIQPGFSVQMLSGDIIDCGGGYRLEVAFKTSSPTASQDPTIGTAVPRFISFPLPASRKSLSYEEGKYSLAFPSISTQAYGFDIDIAARVATDAVKEFLDSHKEPELRIYMVDISESKTLQKFRQCAFKDPRYSIQVADLTTLKSAGIPCWFIVNAANPGFKPKGSGTNEAIHRACRFNSSLTLEKLTLRLYQPPAEVGKAYPVELLPAGPNTLTDQQNVHTVIHVVGPNMNPKRKNCLNGDYEVGKKLLKKAYQELLNCFYERCGISSKMEDIPVPHWFIKSDTGWIPVEEAFSAFIDHVYTAAMRNPNIGEDGRNIVVLGQTTFDFTNMVEVTGQAKPRKIRRGTWFYQGDQDNTWIPYAPDIANQLEKGFQSPNTDRVDVSHDPPRFVVALSKGRFVQYRQTKGGNPLGRAVSRGYNHVTYKTGTQSRTSSQSSSASSTPLSTPGNSPLNTTNTTSTIRSSSDTTPKST